MGLIASLIGGFGAGLAFFGSLAALFLGAMGMSVGVGDAVLEASRAFLGILASFVGVGGAVVVRRRLWAGGTLLLASAVLGLLAVLWFYIAGALLLILGGGMAFWGSRYVEASR